MTRVSSNICKMTLLTVQINYFIKFLTMKILVPTDFSASSKNAVEYASKIATKINAEITLLHLVYRHALPHASILKENLETVMTQNAKQDCIKLVNELKSKNKSLLISYKIMDDFDFENVIENYAVHNNIDLIIMGTRGATRLAIQSNLWK